MVQNEKLRTEVLQKKMELLARFPCCSSEILQVESDLKDGRLSLEEASMLASRLPQLECLEMMLAEKG